MSRKEVIISRRRGVVSLGYEGRSIDEFVEAAVGQDVSVVIDVRLTARSRKPGFSKSAMTDALKAAGIGYVHESGLGNPVWNREAFWNGDVEDGRRAYREIVGTKNDVLERVGRQAAESRVAVVCFERDHERCHRQVVIDLLCEADPNLECIAL